MFPSVAGRIINEAKQIGKDLLSEVAKDKAVKFAASRPPELSRLITRENNLPYLWRHYFDGRKEQILNTRGQKIGEDIEGGDFGVFVHHFVNSDKPGEVHNHPWEWSVALILWGAYKETKYTWAPRAIEASTSESRLLVSVELTNPRIQTFGAFDVNTIDYYDAHRIELIGAECWTLFVHGPRKSTWGFANEKTGAFREIRGRVFEHGVPVTEKRA